MASRYVVLGLWSLVSGCDGLPKLDLDAGADAGEYVGAPDSAPEPDSGREPDSGPEPDLGLEPDRGLEPDPGPEPDPAPELDPEPEPAPEVGPRCRPELFPANGIRIEQYAAYWPRSVVFRVERDGLACPDELELRFERVVDQNRYGDGLGREPMEVDLINPGNDCAAYAGWFPEGRYDVHWRVSPDDTYGLRLRAPVMPVICGNGLLEETETCDDGGVRSGDGCDAACQIEFECGDGQVDGAEVCDGEPGCSDDCLRLCGDGQIQPGEACDGETNGESTCTEQCELTTVCGDGKVRLDEACDRLDLGRPCDVLCTHVDHVWEEPPTGFRGRVPPGESDRHRFEAEAPGELNLRFDHDCPRLEQLELSSAAGPVPLEHVTGQCPMVVRAAVEAGSHTLQINADDRPLHYQMTAELRGCFRRNVARGSLPVGGVDWFDYVADRPFRLITRPDARGLARQLFVYLFHDDKFVARALYAEGGGHLVADPGNYTFQVIAEDGYPVPSYELAVIEEGRCGDGTVDVGEMCDDGNARAGDGCDPSCRTSAVCGDGRVTGGETCDDGGHVPDDGCDATCQREEGRCGDGVVDPYEACDEGGRVAGDGCSEHCTPEVHLIHADQALVRGAFGAEGCVPFEVHVDWRVGEYIQMALDDGVCDGESEIVVDSYPPVDEFHHFPACQTHRIYADFYEGDDPFGDADPMWVCGPAGRRYELATYERRRLNMHYADVFAIPGGANRAFIATSEAATLAVELGGEDCDRVTVHAARPSFGHPIELQVLRVGCTAWFQTPGGPTEITLGVPGEAPATVSVLVGETTLAPLIISELHVDPGAVADSVGEWFEVKNNSPDPIELRGYVFADLNGDFFEVDESLVVQPGGYAVLGRVADPERNGGVELDFEYRGQMILDNQSDAIWILDSEGDVVSSLAYERNGWPLEAGRSMELRTFDTFTADPAFPGNWHGSFAPSFGDGDRGTPGG